MSIRIHAHGGKETTGNISFMNSQLSDNFSLTLNDIVEEHQKSKGKRVLFKNSILHCCFIEI
jgi:hypothetical protein